MVVCKCGEVCKTYHAQQGISVLSVPTRNLLIQLWGDLLIHEFPCGGQVCSQQGSSLINRLNEELNKETAFLAYT